jgi:protein SCO1/2
LGGDAVPSTRGKNEMIRDNIQDRNQIGVLFQAWTLSMALLLASCSDGRLDDYGDLSVRLTDQNGEMVEFPGDFEGSPLMVGFIYTNCPDICPFITSNIKKIEEQVATAAGTNAAGTNVTGSKPAAGTQFVLITFDPERDTQEVLKKYAQAFEMDRPPFRFLTGEPEQIRALMERVSVRTSVTDERELEGGETIYFLSHSDKILLIDRESRLVFDYGGSMTPVRIMAEDLKKLLEEG